VAKTVHFHNKHMDQDIACYTHAASPVTTDKPLDVTCKQCRYNMMLNQDEWKIRKELDKSRKAYEKETFDLLGELEKQLKAEGVEVVNGRIRRSDLPAARKILRHLAD